MRPLDLGLQGKVALVTAASQGLGRAIAGRLAEEGMHVALCSRSADRVRAAAEEVARRGAGREVRVEAWEADVAVAEQVSSLAQRVEQAFGRLDVLVCNAGGPPPGDFFDVGEADWEKAFQQNLMSVVRLVRSCVPLMERSGGGTIVTITSTSIKVPLPRLILSNVMRAGVYALVKSLVPELAARNIRIHTVAPGRIDTGRVRSLDEDLARHTGRPVEEVRRDYYRQIPLGRYGEPEEFAQVVAFLVSDAARYLTGQAVFVDGGMMRAL
ncbi:SDR family oxidoreductase [Thermaerobacter litoralis]